jgi:hypothetical protein
MLEREAMVAGCYFASEKKGERGEKGIKRDNYISLTGEGGGEGKSIIWEERGGGVNI